MDRALRREAVYMIAMLAMIGSTLLAHELEQFLHETAMAQSGEYAQALSLYEACQVEGYGILFNKACCLYKTGQFVPSLATLYKSLRYARGDQCTAVYNLIDRVCMDAGYMHYKTVYDTLVRVAAPYFSYVPLLFFQLFWVILFCFLCYVVCMYRGYVRILLLLMLMMVILCVTGMLMVKRTMLMMNRAVIKKHNVPMYTGPNVRYAMLSSLPEGVDVTQLCMKQDWMKIAYKQHVGWVSSSAVCLV